MHPSTSQRRRDAFTLVDVMGALVVVGVALGGVFAANRGATQLLKSAKQAAVASKCLQQRIEQIRNYNWLEVTDGAAMLELYQTPPLPSVELPGFAEKVTIKAFPPVSPGPADLVVTRDSAGAVTPDPPLVPDPTLPDLVSQYGVRVDVQITWPGPGGRTRMRETSVVLANGGLGR